MLGALAVEQPPGTKLALTAVMNEEQLSWVRHHSWAQQDADGDATEALALVYRCKGKWEAGVHDTPARVVLPGSRARLLVVCDGDAESRVVADGMLLNVHPHNCDTERCGPWRAVA